MGLNFIIILDSRRVLHPAPARLRQAGIQNTDPRGTLGYNTQTREARWDTTHRPARQAGIQNTDPRGRLGYKTQTREAGWDTKHKPARQAGIQNTSQIMLVGALLNPLNCTML